jgi:hypothetical protein
VPTKSIPENNVGVNLDEADRQIVILACCLRLNALGFKNDIGHWRERAGNLDWFELLGRAEELGVELRQGNQPFHLPAELHHR